MRQTRQLAIGHAPQSRLIQTRNETPMVLVHNKVPALIPILVKGIDDVASDQRLRPREALERHINQPPHTAPPAIRTDKIPRTELLDAIRRLSRHPHSFPVLLNLHSLVIEQDLTLLALLDVLQNDLGKLMLSQHKDLVLLARQRFSIDRCDDLTVEFPPADVGAGFAVCATILQDAGAVQFAHGDGVVDCCARALFDVWKHFKDGGGDAGFGEAEGNQKANGAGADLLVSDSVGYCS